MIKRERIKVLHCLNRSKFKCKAKLSHYSDDTFTETTHSKGCCNQRRLDRLKNENKKLLFNVVADLQQQPKILINYNSILNLNQEKEVYEAFQNLLSLMPANRLTLKEVVAELNEKYDVLKLLFPTSTMRTEIKQIYMDCFENYSANKTMESYVDKYVNVIGFFKKDIAAGATFNIFKYNGKSWANLILLGVIQSFRQCGFGSFIIDYLKERFDGIALYSDTEAVDFYFKNGFKKSKLMLNKLYSFIEYEKNAEFMIWESE